jgi:antitoxin component YwqK of YwqJK toxin-antitoxin module
VKKDIINKNDKGQLHGVQIRYYNDNPGQISYKDNYINGEYHGEQIGYHSNGKIAYKDNYINGKQHGIQVGYYSNGQISYKKNYINGKRVSNEEWIAYDRNNKMKMMSNL